MRDADNVNAPRMGGWIIAALAGFITFVALVAIGHFGYFPALVIGILVALIVAYFLGLFRGGSGNATAASTSVAPRPVDVPRAADAGPAAAPAVSPAAIPVAPPAAIVSPPVAMAAADGPERLSAPRGGQADNLKEIEGIGPAMEKLVNGMGFYHFSQIANWSDADVAWVDANMTSFKGRITRDKWVAQAKIIVNEGLEAFRERAKTNNY